MWLTAPLVPIVVIAREETKTSSSALGKKLNLKELRLASEDLLSGFIALDKNSCMYIISYDAVLTMLIYADDQCRYFH
jgi:hypothetical protein